MFLTIQNLDVNSDYKLRSNSKNSGSKSLGCLCSFDGRLQCNVDGDASQFGAFYPNDYDFHNVVPALQKCKHLQVVSPPIQSDYFLCFSTIHEPNSESAFATDDYAMHEARKFSISS
jgi:hypothetical protein